MVIFFDIDDTLISHSSAMRAATIALHQNANLSITLEAFLETWHDAHRRYYPRFLSGELTYAATTRARAREAIDPSLSDKEADDLFGGYLAAYEAGWSVLPDVLPCLDRLTSVRLGVISNGRADEQRRKLVSTEIYDRFEYILISEDCGRAKPNPEIFRLACDAICVSPTEAVYIGDHYELDACGARNAGLCGVWLDRRGVASQDHQGPMIRSLGELFQLAEVQPPNIRMEPTRPS